ncbi:DNA topoisomerase IB [Limnoglobus roseus]|uniref:DNA topoisomerase n=1 Tax=Limnoglobus roseus TaxID=2598579 RepID=A0A5C1AAR5_9BACT|nr:DNA topoisomerase IB [Limnoglobus roseus]QEL15665.1 DNA topoisomerase [Limnoglobus roseus]
MRLSSVTVRLKQTITTRETKVETVLTVHARVCHSDDGKPGIRRERTGKGFRYRAANGKLVQDAATLARIRALAIPPAWEQVWICPKPNGHVQATGRDARGRKQYRYHPAYRCSQDGEKFDRMVAFGHALPRIREKVEADLKLPGLSREKVLAAVVKLLDRTHLRVGNSEYAKSNKSFGLSTLLDKHVSFAGGSVRMKFRGKSGVWHERAIADAKLARIVRNCRDLPGQHLFQYRSDDGKPRPIGSSDVNAYLRDAAGGEFTAKDFRTWAGTVAAVDRLAKLPLPETKAATEKAIVGVVREVADTLGNTPAVCRKSYIHPTALDAFVKGRLPSARSRGGLTGGERRVLRLLSV